MARKDAHAAKTGAALAGAITAGSLRREVMAEYLAAIDSDEPEIQAFAHFDRDRFLAPPERSGPLAVSEDPSDRSPEPTALSSEGDDRDTDMQARSDPVPLPRFESVDAVARG